MVKFLFLICNKHSEIKQELLKHVQKETTLSQCLEFAHSVEGNLQSVELSGTWTKVPQPNNAEIHAMDKKVRQKCHDVTPARQKTGECDSESPKCDKCGLKHKLKECPAFGKQCYKCGKDNHYARLCCRTKKKMAEINFGQEYDSVNVQNVTQEHDQYDDSKWFAFSDY